MIELNEETKHKVQTERSEIWEVLLRRPHEVLFVFQSFMHIAKNTTTERGDIEGGRKLEY